MINSSALVFTPKPWFKIPEFTNEQLSTLKKARMESRKARGEFMQLI